MLLRARFSTHNGLTLRRRASRIPPRGGLEADERANLSAHKVVDGRKNGGRTKCEVIDPQANGVPREFVTATRRAPFLAALAMHVRKTDESFLDEEPQFPILNRFHARRSVSWLLAEAKRSRLVDVAVSAGDAAY